jgi:NADPH-dependent glutamate synthase beta subunit-like oxidoreductase
VTEEELDASMTEATREEIATGRVPKRMDKLLRKVSDRPIGKGDEKILELSFLKSPLEIIPSETNLDIVGGIRVAHNLLSGPTGKQRAVSGDEEDVIPCDIVLRSVGYLGVPLEGVPFDEERCVIANSKESSGRVIDYESGESVLGMFTSGWAKRGPNGIVGTNIPCAKETVKAILEDQDNLLLPAIQQVGGVEELLKQKSPEVVDWSGYMNINDHEVRVGEEKGKVRDKLFTAKKMLQVANGDRSEQAYMYQHLLVPLIL